MIAIQVTPPKNLKKQLRFATAQAVTAVAFEARTTLNETMAESFLLRRKFTQKRTRVQKAGVRKAEALVGSPLEYLRDQLVGATRQHASKPLGVRRSNKRVISRAKWPSTMRGGRFFTLRAGDRRGPKFRGRPRGTKVILRRSKSRGGKLKAMWELPPTQRIKPRWSPWPRVEQTVRAKFPAIYERAIAKALLTAR